MRELVLIHGRAQAGKDAGGLKQEWLKFLANGLAKSGLSLPIEESSVHFPYYGDTLAQLAKGLPLDQVSEVNLKGPNVESESVRLLVAILEEVRAELGVHDDDISAADSATLDEKGVVNWPWVRAILQGLDQRSNVSAAAIALATWDVSCYLTRRTVRLKIDEGVAAAIQPGVETVVVGHSLGSVVAYNVLQAMSADGRSPIQRLITIGSPLAVTAIRDALPDVIGWKNRTPKCVKNWFNAMDPRDPVALYPLDVEHFPLSPKTPAIKNKLDVKNPTPNRHGIAGYLEDAEVAKNIYDALTCP